MHEAARRLLESGRVDGRTGTHPLHSAIDAAEAACLSAVIEADPAVTRTLEVGCGYGVSALTIAGATAGRPGASHTIIDPHQEKEWDGAGLQQLERAGLSHASLMERPSEFVLPELAATEAGRFHLVFLDGWHTFDHVMVDAFYATRLLAIGGYLACDDVTFPSVRRAVDYLLACPCYELHAAAAVPARRTWKRRFARVGLSLLPGPVAEALTPALRRRIQGPDESLVVLRKVRADERNWDWDPETR
ncbi:MAG: class I SAM-dependent methyltransferase [Alphaproteobacteria bacterium]